jgi:hypothetical protein
MTDLDALIERVRGLEGPSREVDALVLCALLAPVGSFVEQSKINGAWCVYERSNRLWEKCPQELRGVSLTASLDAVIALIERELPKCAWSIERVGGCITATITYRWKIGEIGATPALALLRAFFSAIKEQRS